MVRMMFNCVPCCLTVWEMFFSLPLLVPAEHCSDTTASRRILADPVLPLITMDHLTLAPGSGTLHRVTTNWLLERDNQVIVLQIQPPPSTTSQSPNHGALWDVTEQEVSVRDVQKTQKCCSDLMLSCKHGSPQFGIKYGPTRS